MKILTNIIRTTIATCVLFGTINAGTVGSASSNIKNITYHTKDTGHYENLDWNGKYWFSIDTEIADCPSVSGGGALLGVSNADKEVLGLLLTAKVTEQKVTVFTDPAKLVSGYCQMSYIKM
ncbi:MAG: hypothetical protein OCC49_13725 [Fibrobacterales bacterium]